MGLCFFEEKSLASEALASYVRLLYETLILRLQKQAVQLLLCADPLLF